MPFDIRYGILTFITDILYGIYLFFRKLPAMDSSGEEDVESFRDHLDPLPDEGLNLQPTDDGGGE